MKKRTFFNSSNFKNTLNQSSSEGIPTILRHDFDSLFMFSNNASPPWHFLTVIVLEPEMYFSMITLNSFGIKLRSNVL